MEVSARPDGDANDDGKVDHEDLALFNAQFGLRGPDQSCDFDTDNDVDLDDFKILKDNWHWGVGGAGNLTIEPIPEPAGLSVLALGGLALLRRRAIAPRPGTMGCEPLTRIKAQLGVTVTGSPQWTAGYK